MRELRHLLELSHEDEGRSMTPHRHRKNPNRSHYPRDHILFPGPSRRIIAAPREPGRVASGAEAVRKCLEQAQPSRGPEGRGLGYSNLLRKAPDLVSGARSGEGIVTREDAPSKQAALSKI